MQFGIYLNQYLHQPGASVFPELVGQAQLADALGYDFIGLGERHLHPEGFHELLTTLATLASLTQRVRLCSAGFILPAYHPVFLATALANIDQISGGRLICGVVLGYRPEELALFGVSPKRRAQELEKRVQLLRRLWRGETIDLRPFGYEVEAFVSPLPAQPGGPPIWIGAHALPAIQRAARLGDGWIGSASLTIAEVSDLTARYREACATYSRPGQVILMRDAFVAPSRAEAEKVLAGPLLNLLRCYAEWKRASPDQAKYQSATWEEVRPRLICGDPEECRRLVIQYARLGVDALLLRFQPPGLPDKEARRAITLFAHEVMPAVREATK
ncbi:MAG: LLM class flavin-dependent oxidoreductase [Anaerolineae bacterium]|nr:LLM class flavin-dependent oxidoreductase [Anaerolineae bacterium]MDW8099981.1 LLM class flavin-dependent oxidoreductase [Anaerolineae bacterium]